MVPVIVGWIGHGALQRQGFATAAVGLTLILGGACVIWGAFGRLRSAVVSIPAPVRAVMAANVLFLAFCALETSDGLVVRGGRIVYWTSFLFVPALVVLYGQVLAQHWVGVVGSPRAFRHLHALVRGLPRRPALRPLTIEWHFGSLVGQALHGWRHARLRRYLRLRLSLPRPCRCPEIFWIGSRRLVLCQS
jgi:hypothetical protein